MIRRLLVLKCLALALVASGCLHIAMEQHGGAAPIPSKVTDAEFAALGAGVDLALGAVVVPVLRKLPLFRWIPPTPLRLAGDATALICVRSCSPFGRSVDSGLLMLIGAFPVNFARFVPYAHQENRRREACQSAAGPDTVVRAVAVLPVTGCP